MEFGNNSSSSKSKKVLAIVLPLIFSIGLGVGAGILINKLFLGPAVQVDYESFSSNSYEPNVDSAMAKYNAAKSNGGNYQSTMSATEMVNVGYKLYENTDNRINYQYGLVDAKVVKQTIRAVSIKVGNKYFEEQISNSWAAQVAARTFQDGDQISFYRGNNGTETAAQWENQAQVYTIENYIEDFGRAPSTAAQVFIISDRTVNYENTSIKKEDGLYKIHLDFKVPYSVLKYVCQMKSISDLAEKPSFYSLNVDYVLDSDLMILSMTTHEHYYARTKQGVGSESTGSLEVFYYTDRNPSIPNLTDNIDYSVGRRS